MGYITALPHKTQTTPRQKMADANFVSEVAVGCVISFRHRFCGTSTVYTWRNRPWDSVPSISGFVRAFFRAATVPGARGCRRYKAYGRICIKRRPCIRVLAVPGRLLVANSHCRNFSRIVPLWTVLSGWNLENFPG